MIVLDTHAWVWWINRSDQLSARALEHIETADHIGVATISCLEIATLARRGRLRLSLEVSTWIEAALEPAGVVPLALTARIAIDAGSMSLHGDPADRIITATALNHGAGLITKDDRMRKSKLVKTIW